MMMTTTPTSKELALDRESWDIRPSDCLLQKSFDTTISAFPLSHYLSQSSGSKLFIHVFLLNWDFKEMDHKTFVATCLYYLAVIGVVIYVSIIIFMYIADAGDYDYVGFTDRTKYFVVLYIFTVSLCSQLTSDVLSTVFIARRVSGPCLQTELQYFPVAMKICIGFTMFFMTTVLLGISLELVRLQSTASIVTLELVSTVTLTIATSGSVAINLLFVLVDAWMSESILNNLNSLARQQQLTVVDIQAAREEISKRVKRFLFPTLLMAVNAVICLVTFIVALYFGAFISPGAYLLGISWYFKEVFYLFTTLFYSAHLNGIADRLSRHLGDDTWESSLEMTRLQSFVNLQAKPIAFRLFGMRPTKYTVFWQILSVGVAVILSFARGLYTNR